MGEREEQAFRELISRGYCFGHWVALMLVMVYQPRLFLACWPLDCFLTALMIVLPAELQWAPMCWFVAKVRK
jgi:hypothetical protein